MPTFDRARDPNDTTFYVLRYPTDFGEGGEPAGPFQPESSPFLSAELFHDAERHVTELRPADPRFESQTVTKFINNLMLDGKKTTAQRAFYNAMDEIGRRKADVKSPAAVAARSGTSDSGRLRTLDLGPTSDLGLWTLDARRRRASMSPCPATPSANSCA